MLLKIVQNINSVEPNGFKVALNGIITVFIGLILIAFSIWLFNVIFKYFGNRKKEDIKIPGKGMDVSKAQEKIHIKKKKVDDDTLIAIATALELYQRLHIETLQSKITFKSGKQKSNWKLGYKVGHRDN
ncbi:MAG: hypothetical protein FXF47_00330 [Candidatus Mcinerneyibacterium aminivorans]|jgi:hypothetical protein|uniref:Oxaloacetate decarboxylase gamma chain n=1 Tax=Candidatus Mcinerneyibacterium aminivorans TaxID=2703815 RepID=A0A5D0MEW4_9BACT|nr:MAG: hypothetical protein FXF47_00330 [Candidatus Mcinerneyibacterium aminivorans]